MKNPMFSILIPNYGFSPLIFECLDSAVNQQTEDLFTYEILVCDQSESDIFLKLKNEIDKRYGNKVTFFHRNVKGVLMARHDLMRRSNGKYIVFLDSDDFIDLNGLILLYKKIIKEEPDVIVTGYKRTNVNGCFVENSPNMLQFEKRHFYDYFLCSNRFNSICFKIFKSNLYSFNNYSYFESSNGEDKNFSLPIINNAKIIFFADDLRFYNYRINPLSLTHKMTIEQARSSLFLLENLNIDINVFSKFQKKLFYKSFLNLLSSTIGILKKYYSHELIFKLLDDSRLFCKKNFLFKSTGIRLKTKLKSFLLKNRFYLIFLNLAGK